MKLEHEEIALAGLQEQLRFTLSTMRFIASQACRPGVVRELIELSNRAATLNLAIENQTRVVSQAEHELNIIAQN